jgi:hypothetical protein
VTALADDPDLALAVALARELLHGTAALTVSIALDRDEPALIECSRLRGILVRETGRERELPHDAAAEVDLPDLPLMRRLPPMDADPVTGEVTGVIGGLDMLVEALRAFAGLLPGASVVAADYETNDPDVPLGLAARSGEPVVALLGEHEFELD